MQLSRKTFHEQVYNYTLILIAISLPLSVFLTSALMLLLMLNWVVEGGFPGKWKKVAGNRALQLFLLLAGIHLAGLLWSADLAYGLRDVKIKLPLLSFPVIVVTSAPLSRKHIQRILLFFTLSVFVASMASVFKLLGWVPGELLDYRDLSLFMSHIRFSLMIVLALLIIVYSLFFIQDPIPRAQRLFYITCLVWFPVFLVLLKSLSGIIIAGLLGFFILLRLAVQIRDQAIRFMVLVAVIMIPLFSIIYLGNAVNRFYTFDPLIVEELDTLTIEGNNYINAPERREVENGHYVWIHVCDEELGREWNTVSDLDYSGRTLNGMSLRTTLIRFLTSKGLRKDAAGFRQLSDEELRAIESGTSNYIFLDRLSFYPRVYEVIWEIDRYRMGYPPNNKSVVQRYLYLQAGWAIAGEHPVFGVGNGDVLREFKNYYDKVNSPLEGKQRRAAHNQYLTILVGLGTAGLLISLLALVVPLFLANRHRSFLATGFLVLILLSMLSDDTLDSTTGVALTGFFYSLFVFGPDFPWLNFRFRKEDG